MSKWRKPVMTCSPRTRARRTLRSSWLKKWQALVSAGAVALGFGDLVEELGADGGVFEGADELEVATIGGGEELAQVAEAVDGLLEGSELENGRAVPMFHVAVVL
jgi:hypothetical protein